MSQLDMRSVLRGIKVLPVPSWVMHLYQCAHEPDRLGKLFPHHVQEYNDLSYAPSAGSLEDLITADGWYFYRLQNRSWARYHGICFRMQYASDFTDVLKHIQCRPLRDSEVQLVEQARRLGVQLQAHEYDRYDATQRIRFNRIRDLEMRRYAQGAKRRLQEFKARKALSNG